MKWHNKAFAMTNMDGISLGGWRIWIDGDVTFHAPMTEVDWCEILDDEYLGVYIGRTDWPHSECGFLALNLGRGGVSFLLSMREIWASDAVFRLREWHDAWVFDTVRAIYQARGFRFKDLAAGVGGMHPWPQTVLGRFMTHHKGPVAKGEQYGRPV